MKAIFLDVDGVLTNSGYRNPETKNIDPEKIELINEIVKQTGAVIVLTSTWKDGYNKDTGEKDDYYKVLEHLMLEHGLQIYDITDKIPALTRESMYVSISLNDLEFVHCVHGTGRGAEVDKWINDHHPDSYVILDDEDHGWKEYGYEDAWVQTSWYDPNGGLGKNDVKKAIVILNQNENQKNSANGINSETEDNRCR